MGLTNGRNRAEIKGGGVYFMAFSPGGRVLSMNQTLLQAVGARLELIIGKPFLSRFVPREGRDVLAAAMHQLRSRNDSILAQVPIRAANGGVLQVERQTRVLRRSDGRIRQVMAAVSIPGLDADRGFLHNLISRGLASAHIKAQPVGSRLRKALETIVQDAERGGKIVQRLLNFSRQIPTEEQDLDVNALLQENARLLEYASRVKVRLELDPVPALPRIRGDGSTLTHAFMNLCVNVLEAMPETGTLTLRTLNPGNGWIEVQVEDTGSGMPKQVLKKALDSFFTTKGTGKGAGLGLALVHRTVKAHRGHLEIHSEPGHGTCARMLLPLAAPATGSHGPASEPRPHLPRQATGGLLEGLGHDATLVSGGAKH
jgi:signal transduction histidine kinase